MEQIKHEIGFVNIAKTIGISLVIFGHLSIPKAPLLFLSSFRMPLIFLLSGFLLSCKKYDLKSFTAKKAKTLLIPYLFFAVVSFLFWYFAGRKLIDGESGIDPLKYIYGILLAIPTKEYLGFNIPIWFLPSLFCSEMIFFAYKKYIGRYMAVFCVLLFFAGIIFKCYAGVRLPYGLDVSMFSILFMYLGYWLRKKEHIITRVQQMKRWLRIAGIITFGLLTYWLALQNSASGCVSVYSLQFHNYFLFICAAGAGIIFVLLLSVSIPHNSVFRFFGRNTIVILGFHLMCFSVLKGIQVFIFHIPVELAYHVYLPNLLYVMLTYLMLAPVIYFINRFAPFLLGRKKGIW